MTHLGIPREAICVVSPSRSFNPNLGPNLGNYIMAHKKINMFKLTPHMGNMFNRIEQDPDADMQAVMDMTHRADMHNERAMQDWERQQMVARMQAKLAQFKQARK
jgi:hypothetical protein|tara:strand:+ start:486 stop:800 length:315 start_codon:yes stop_codon:yes gene_type:complete